MCLTTSSRHNLSNRGPLTAKKDWESLGIWTSVTTHGSVQQTCSNSYNASRTRSTRWRASIFSPTSPTWTSRTPTWAEMQVSSFASCSLQIRQSVRLILSLTLTSPLKSCLMWVMPARGTAKFLSSLYCLKLRKNSSDSFNWPPTARSALLKSVKHIRMSSNRLEKSAKARWGRSMNKRKCSKNLGSRGLNCKRRSREGRKWTAMLSKGWIKIWEPFFLSERHRSWSSLTSWTMLEPRLKYVNSNNKRQLRRLRRFKRISMWKDASIASSKNSSSCS